jgi:gas vesicle protein
VAEAGFMMDNEALQKLIGHFVELKNKIDGVTAGQEELKTELNAGQEGLKNDMKTEMSAVKNDISAVKNDIENSISENIGALETKINAGHEELRQEINAFQERIRNIEDGQEKFEERVTRTVNTLLEDVSSMVEQQTRNLREYLSRNIEAGQAEFEERVTRNLREDLSWNIEATRRGFETNLVDLEAQTRRAGGNSAGPNADKVKPSKFDGSTSWFVFQRQLAATVVHNDWTPGEKAAHLLSVLQGQAADVLHSVPAGAPYEDIVGALQDQFGDHQLPTAYRSQLKTRVQAGGETLQEFAAAVEQLAHRDLVGLPEGHIQTEAAHAFIDGIRDREVIQHLLKAAGSDYRPYWDAIYTTRAPPK